MEKNISNEILEELAKTHIKDVKSKRRWRIFVRSVIVLLVILVIVPNLFFSPKELGPHVALVKVDGVIAADSQASAQRINKSLDNAYESKMTKAVVVEVNSPGGSPVQSDEIYSHMQYLQKKYPEKPLYAVCTDVCASGGYYIAAGAKNIYVNKMTITGSVGVIGNSFGFTGLIDKLGIERRVYISGKNKNFLDPFSPQKTDQVEDYQKLLDQSHQVFIDAVLRSRGNRLKDKSKETTFSGQPFSGIEAEKIGLVDGFASIDQLKYEKLDGMDIVDYTQPLDFLTKISNKLTNGVYYKALLENSFSLK
ncbi:S49 family peptidase [Allofrancisella guangzhouensis]|uniref:Multidrug transporter n=1 Tax=Allofrancisella guangzhouensis TaxID=594679 RepID=A0A0A8E415_9GAMM|nr:S49 family peptidase [Allofrancisella guangzhouensis]AJC48352.1 multidrug transporter [Allofrancisella guangzhouensis]MBK2026555.1 S49 family peptidase [Allofrancisella guangzhouensis]MBK2044299.1 S49 family peptidase [Allofrancisella guangzhouensis]MBK2045542.1 S49 family peptidase [Allofrancisella guangzhouensis]